MCRKGDNVSFTLSHRIPTTCLTIFKLWGQRPAVFLTFDAQHLAECLTWRRPPVEWMLSARIGSEILCGKQSAKELTYDEFSINVHSSSHPWDSNISVSSTIPKQVLWFFQAILSKLYSLRTLKRKFRLFCLALWLYYFPDSSCILFLGPWNCQNTTCHFCGVFSRFTLLNSKYST